MKQALVRDANDTIKGVVRVPTPAPAFISIAVPGEVIAQLLNPEIADMPGPAQTTYTLIHPVPVDVDAWRLPT